MRTPAIAPGINRNILECKFYGLNSILKHPEVLIETYWNVNEGRSSCKAVGRKY